MLKLFVDFGALCLLIRIRETTVLEKQGKGTHTGAQRQRRVPDRPRGKRSPLATINRSLTGDLS